MKKLCIAFLLALFLLPCSTALAAPDTAGATGTIDKEAFKTMLREVLKENPEILFDIMKQNDSEFIKTITTASETSRTSELETQWKKDIKEPKTFVTANRPYLGDKNAPNTLYIFSDFLCTYCQKTAGVVEAFIKEHKDVKLIFKAFPKSDEGKMALRWFYLLAQKDMKKAWQLHDTVFVHQQAYANNPLEVLKEIVRQQGLNPEQVAGEAEKRQAELDTLINEDIKEAEKYHVAGTPYLFLNNLVMVGTQNLATLESALKFSLKK